MYEYVLVLLYTNITNIGKYTSTVLGMYLHTLHPYRNVFGENPKRSQKVNKTNRCPSCVQTNDKKVVYG